MKKSILSVILTLSLLLPLFALTSCGKCLHENTKWTVVEKLTKDGGRRTGTCPDCGEELDESVDGTAFYVLIETSEKGKMLVELYPDYAPTTVQNFRELVFQGFYNGLTFHRIIDGFMIQGGDPEGTGYGGSGTDIYGEFASNGYTQNTLKHEAGVISMARSNDPNSASSQFFICTGERSRLKDLDGEYAAFGRVVYGLDHAIALSRVDTNYNDRPLKTVKMTSVTLLSAEEAAEYLK